MPRESSGASTGTVTNQAPTSINTKTVIVAAGVGITCFLLPGALMLTSIHANGATSNGPPNWALALGGALFALLGIVLTGAALCQRFGGNWRKLALVGMMSAFPTTAFLLGWPAIGLKIPLGDGRMLAPGPATAGPTALVARVGLGVASAAFGLASAVLWWLVLSGRVTSEDVRGIGEH